MHKRGWLVLLLVSPLVLIAIGTQVAALTGIVGLAQTGTRRPFPGQHRARARHVDPPGGRADPGCHLVLASGTPARVQPHDIGRGGRPARFGTRHRGRQPRAGSGGAGGGNDPRLRCDDPDDLGDDDRHHEGCRTSLGPRPSCMTPWPQRRRRWSEVTGTGLLGRPVGAVADSLRRHNRETSPFSPERPRSRFRRSPRRLGEQEPKRYLVCALNDAELFGSGGAPLFAVMVEAVRGSITIPLSGAAGVEAVAAQPADRVGACRRARHGSGTTRGTRS